MYGTNDSNATNMSSVVLAPTPPLLPPPLAPQNATNETFPPPLYPPPQSPPPPPPYPGSVACYTAICREFAFYREPVISVISPTGGPIAGGFTIVALGARFDGMNLNASIARCAFGRRHVTGVAGPRARSWSGWGRDRGW